MGDEPRGNTPAWAKRKRRLERENKRLRYELGVAAHQAPLLRAIIEGSADGLALVNPDGEIREHNTAFSRMFERKDLMLGESVLVLFYSRREPNNPETIPLLSVDLLQQVLAFPQRVHGFCDGQPVEVSLSPFRHSDKSFIVCSARILDTEGMERRLLHEARSRVHELNEALRHHRNVEKAARFESLSLLAGTLAHDLNNALVVVQGNVELLRLSLEDPELIDMTHDISEGASAVSELAQRLRTFSQGPQMNCGPLHLTEWLPRYLEPLGKSLRIRLVLTFPQTPCTISGDPSQLGQVFLNLITNAVQIDTRADRKFSVVISPEAGGEGPGHVAVIPACKGPHIHVRCTDTGPGFPSDQLERLCEPFFTTRQGGSGLGLASVAGIVSAHMGGMFLENPSSGGASVLLTFPMIKPTDSIAAPTFTADALVGCSVLVLDDETLVRQVIGRHLEAAGAQVHLTGTSAQAEKTYAQLRSEGTEVLCVIDLVLEMDIDGIETLSRLRSKWPDIRAIACSGHSKVDMVDAYASFGFAAYVAKPFTRAGLVEALLKARRAE